MHHRFKYIVICLLLLLLIFSSLSLAYAENRLSWVDWNNQQKTIVIDNPDIAETLQSNINDALTQEPVTYYQPTYSIITVTLEDKEYKIDIQYNEESEYVLVDQGTAYPFNRMAGKFIHHITELQLSSRTKLSFSVPKDVAELFSQSGYSPAYHIQDLKIKLPKKIECKNTSAVGTYFAFVSLLLEDGDWDLSSYGNKEITAEIYGTYEHCNGALFSESYMETEPPVLFSIRAVVLRYKGRIIGAYLTCDQYPTWMLSVQGRTATELLGERSLEDYLRSHYTMTATDKKAAKLSPEKVIQAWAKAKSKSSANVYESLEHWLIAAILYTRDDQLYVTVADQNYEALAPKGIKRLTAVPEYDSDNGYHHYDAGFTYISVKDYGSDIGWKVEGNGGF